MIHWHQRQSSGGERCWLKSPEIGHLKVAPRSSMLLALSTSAKVDSELILMWLLFYVYFSLSHLRLLITADKAMLNEFK